MLIVRTAVFEHEDVAVLARAQNLIDIAFPLADDPLVRRSTEARSRAVARDDQRRKVLGGLCNPYDPISRPRLVLAERSLSTLLDQVVKESDVAYWISVADTPVTDQAKRMAEVLAAERTGQQRLVRDALAIVVEALDQIPFEEDPVRLRSTRWED